MPGQQRHHVVLAGGGNTGSHAAMLLPRISTIGKITVIDPDVYEARNASNQAIGAASIGRLKVDVLRDVMLEINGDLVVESLRERVEDVPLGTLRSDLLCSCVDNRAARQHINEAACRLGIPWINVAVGEPALARVDAYRTTQSGPCMECSWGQDQYDALSQVYACDHEDRSTAPTVAAAELGAVSGAILANEARKLLVGADAPALVGRELMLDLQHYTRHLYSLERNPNCRFDHENWLIEAVEVDPNANFGELVELVDAVGDTRLTVFGQTFVTHLDCTGCKRRVSVGLKLLGRIDRAARTCHCGHLMVGAGFYCYDDILVSELSSLQSLTSLRELGLRFGDVVSIDSNDGERRHYELFDSRERNA